jgi:putative spermidine/putrescine transport system substrate-binding protein
LRLTSQPNRSRRALVPLVAAAILGLAACGGPAASSSSPQATPIPEKELTVAGPAGASGAAFKGLIQTWATANGITLTYIEGTSASSFAKIQAQAQAGQMQIDMINNNDQITALGRAQGIWAPVNFKLFTVKNELDSTYAFPKDVMGDPPVGVRIFIIPSGIAYNADVFAKNGWSAPTSWLDLVSPTYAKCLVPLDPTNGVPWIPMLNYITTGDWTKADTTFADLKKVSKSISSWTQTNPGALNLVGKGTGCITPTSQGRYIEASQTAPNLKYVTPKEGVVMFGGTLAITKLAPHPIAAQMALNMLLGAAAGQKLLETTYFASVNTKVTHPTSGPAASVSLVTEFKGMSPKQVPIATYDHVSDWVHQYQALASSS